MLTENEKLQNLKEFAAKINGKVWQKNGKTRIYLPGTQAVNVYIDFAPEDWELYEKDMDGGCLKAWKRYDKMNVKPETMKAAKHEAMLEIAAVLGIQTVKHAEDVIL